MTHLLLAASLVVVVGGALALSCMLIVGRARLARVRAVYPERSRAIAPYLALLVGVLVVNGLTRHLTPEVSWLIGWNITGGIYAIEGAFVAVLQSTVPGTLTPFFSFMYVYGYVFLLVFPLIAYFALEELRYLRETCLAYTLNYSIGLLCYVAFVAYGPRNLMPDMVESLLYANWPSSHLLTSQVNTRTNVFPSLHSSLSITVGLLAYRTRAHYPAWLGVAAVIAGSVTFSTMYLGIHWLLDVLAGGALAGVAVRGATVLDARPHGRYRTRLVENEVTSRVGGYLQLLRDAVNARR